MRLTDVISLFAPPLAACGVEWMVAGGVAAIVYGEPIDALAREANELGISAQWQEMIHLNE